MTNRGWKAIDNKKSNGAGNSTGYHEQRRPIRERAYASAALDGCAEELARTAAGDRNNILYKKSFRIGTMVARGWIAANRGRSGAVRRCHGLRPGRRRRRGADPQDHQVRTRRRQTCHTRIWMSRRRTTTIGRTPQTRDTEEPIPLFPPLPPAARFPVEALGDVLSKATLAIARKVQVPEVIAAQSVLGAAALAAQAIADVRMPYGDTRPLSLFFTTVAVSGDRKTTADKSALWPIRKYEDDTQAKISRRI